MAQAIQPCPSQKKTYELKARELSITWGNDCRYWQWEKSPCGCDEYAVLKQVWWLNIEGKICASKIPACIPYEIVLDLGMTDCAEGWSKPVHLEINVPGHCPIKRDACLKGEKGKCDFKLNLGHFTTQLCAQGEITFKLYEHSDDNRKTGLIVKKAIIRPAIHC